MSEGKEAETQSKSKLKLPRFSSAFKFASIVAVTLLALILFSWLLYCLSPDRVAWADYMTLPRALGLLILHATCTVLAYFGAQVWFDDVPSTDRASEKSFRKGLEAAREKGIDIRDLPLNLILGVEDRDRQAALIANSGERSIVHGVEAANGTCSWFVTDAAIHLFCNRSGVFGLAAKRIREQVDHRDPGYRKTVSSTEQALAGQEGSGSLLNASGNVTQSEVVQHEESMQGDTSRQTTPFAVQAHVGGGNESVGAQASVATQPQESKTKARAIVEVDAITGRMDELTNLVEAEVASETVVARKMRWKGTAEGDLQGVLTSAERVACEQRLLELCSRLRASRRPVAPLNSLFIVVDGHSVLKSTESAVTLGEAVQSDIALIESRLGVVAPTTVLVDGIENFTGFEELVKRLGPRVASSALLGETNAPERLCTPNSTHEFAHAAVQNMSDLVTSSIRDPRAFSVPGVRNLFRLRLLVGESLAAGVRQFLESALRVGKGTSRSHFSGLFFGSRGTRTSESAFLPSVFQRLSAQQELVQWNARERRSQGIQSIVLRALQFQCVVLVILLAVQIVGGL